MSLARLSAFPHRRRHVIADWQSNRMTEVFAYRVRDTFMLFGTGDFCLNIPRRGEYYCTFLYNVAAWKQRIEYTHSKKEGIIFQLDGIFFQLDGIISNKKELLVIRRNFKKKYIFTRAYLSYIHFLWFNIFTESLQIMKQYEKAYV